MQAQEEAKQRAEEEQKQADEELRFIPDQRKLWRSRGYITCIYLFDL